MANAVERGWKVDMMAVIGNWVRSHPMENVACFTYMPSYTKFGIPPNFLEKVMDKGLNISWFYDTQEHYNVSLSIVMEVTP
jgi:hypothetical protein